ncbi:MAG TPA: DUF998 domain-containing protein [Phycisphaerae bacterium]|nr:DUF998 domain-containing protein [Phycisphaerae bacterium]
MVARHSRKTPRFTSRFFATTAIACFAYALFALLLLHVLRPDFAPASHMISEYAIGRYGWVMTTCFLAMSCGCMMLLLGLARSGPGSVVAWVGTILLGIPAIGLVVSAFFPMDSPGAPSTRSGEIHDNSFFVNVITIFLVTVLLSVGFGRHPRWRTFQRTAVLMSALIVVAFVLQFLTLHRGMPYGLANRFFFLVLTVWFFATALRLRALASE